MNPDSANNTKVPIVRPERGLKSNAPSTNQSKKAQEVPISLAALSRNYLGDASVSRKNPIWSNKYDDDSDEDSSCDGSKSGINVHTRMPGSPLAYALPTVTPSDVVSITAQYYATPKVASNATVSELSSTGATSPPAVAAAVGKTESTGTKVARVAVALKEAPKLAVIQGSLPVVANADPTITITKIATPDVMTSDKTSITVTKEVHVATIIKPAAFVPCSKNTQIPMMIKTKSKMSFPILARRFAGIKAARQAAKTKEAGNLIVTKSSPKAIDEAASNITANKPSTIHKASLNTIIIDAAPEPTFTTKAAFETIAHQVLSLNVITTVDESSSDTDSLKLSDDEGSYKNDEELIDDDILDSDDEEDLLNAYLMTKKPSWDEHLFTNMNYKFCGICF